jgi:hypothetical protein
MLSNTKKTKFEKVLDMLVTCFQIQKRPNLKSFCDVGDMLSNTKKKDQI